jgi:hypothetical protein
LIIFNRKEGHYSDRRICEIMILNEIHYNPATSTFLSVVCSFWKVLIRKVGSCVSNQPGYIHTISRWNGILLHRKGKLTTAKSKSWRMSYSVVVSLPLELILSKISRYQADLSDSVVLYFEFIGKYQVDIIVKIIIVDW